MSILQRTAPWESSSRIRWPNRCSDALNVGPVRLIEVLHCCRGHATDVSRVYHQCADSDDIFTAEKRSVFLSRVIPRAVSVITSILSVIPVVGNLTVGSTQPCSTDMVPLTQSSFADTDFLFLVTAGPIVSASTLAWATSCAVDQVGRPVVGHMNFKPRAMNWNVNTTDKELDMLVRTAVHEFTHALGFSSIFFEENSVPTTW